MFTAEGDYIEPGYCPDCGLPLDADGDCPNPLCPTMLAFETLDDNSNDEQH